MTFPATRKVRASSRPGRAIGLTLLETLLALTIVTSLLVVGVVNYAAWGQTERLEEGARSFQTLVLMARSDAANLARKVRLDFGGPPAGAVRLLWEPRPLEEPEAFVDYVACTYLHHLPNELVSVAASRRTGDSALRLLASDMRSEQDGERFQSVTFYPDGTCDSAEIDLASTAPADGRIARLTIDGLTGAVTCQIVSAEQAAEEGGGA